MGFFPNYDRAPEQPLPKKRGLARLFELLGRDWWDFFRAGLLALLGALPFLLLLGLALASHALVFALAAGLAGGLAGYFWGIAPATRAADRTIKWLLTRPFALAHVLVLRPLAGLLAGAARGAYAGFVQKKNARRKLKRTKQLQNQGRVLYNS